MSRRGMLMDLEREAEQADEEFEIASAVRDAAVPGVDRDDVLRSP